jgi:hypothetical protein
MLETEMWLADLIDAVLKLGGTYSHNPKSESPEVIALKAKEHLNAKGWDWETK